jgi:uncharacterized membrane protein YhaH (DUF805 family)
VYNTTTTYTQSANTGANPIVLLIYLAIIVVAIAAMWRIYKKAGQPGWAAIVPVYNLYVQLKIVGRPGWWLLLFLIPLVNLVVAIIISIDMAKSFGKSTLFGVVGLFLFSFIGYLMLGFGSAQYVGPAAAEGGQSGQPGGGSPAPVPGPAPSLDPAAPQPAPQPAPPTNPNPPAQL